MPNRPSPAQRAALKPYVESGMLSIVSELAKKLTAPYWWYDPTLPDSERILGGGTMCFVHTGERILGVTAGHIHAECVNALATVPGLACQVGGHSFNPERNLIDVDQDLDLAVYGFSEIEVNAARADVHFAPCWPPSDTAALPYMVCGWPWMLSESDGGQTHHSFVHFIAKQTDRTDRNLIITVGPSTSVPWGTTALPEGTNLGGMSGGPVYQINDGLTVLSLVGVVYEYHVGFELVRARPLSLVNPGGSLCRLG